MKKTLLLASALIAGIASTNVSAQTRYLEEVFTDVDVTSNVTYGTNFSVLTGSPISQDLVMDIYEPTGDTETDRPLILYLPTGSFLPRYINQLPTGDKTDSATVEMCTRLAKQGYVVAAVEYRRGWNPQGTQDQRTETIINAVFRGLQDTKTCVRFFRKDVATNSNSYGIDESKIIVGGQGSGGYISLAYGSVNKLPELQLTKFFNFTTNAFMVDTSLVGDWDGLGGNPALNNSNHVGYSSDVSMTFNIGGAIGDSTWIEAGEVPIVSIQGVADAFAPFSYGIVNVPGTTLFVVDVSGASDVSRIGNAFGNNDVFKTPAISDAYTTAANGYNTSLDATYGNDGDEGLFPIVGAADGNGPWEFWDDATASAGATAYGQDPATILANGYASNPVYQALGPVAGEARAQSFMDTIQGYLAPRMYRVLFENSSSVEDVTVSNVSVYPNPTNGRITFVAEDNNPISVIDFYSMEGKVVRRENAINASTIEISNLDLPKGIYFATVRFKEGTTTKKVIIK